VDCWILRILVQYRTVCVTWAFIPWAEDHIHAGKSDVVEGFRNYTVSSTHLNCPSMISMTRMEIVKLVEITNARPWEASKLREADRPNHSRLHHPSELNLHHPILLTFLPREYPLLAALPSHPAGSST